MVLTLQSFPEEAFSKEGFDPNRFLGSRRRYLSLEDIITILDCTYRRIDDELGIILSDHYNQLLNMNSGLCSRILEKIGLTEEVPCFSGVSYSYPKPTWNGTPEVQRDVDSETSVNSPSYHIHEHNTQFSTATGKSSSCQMVPNKTQSLIGKWYTIHHEATTLKSNLQKIYDDFLALHREYFVIDRRIKFLEKLERSERIIKIASDYILKTETLLAITYPSDSTIVTNDNKYFRECTSLADGGFCVLEGSDADVNLQGILFHCRNIGRLQARERMNHNKSGNRDIQWKRRNDEPNIEYDGNFSFGELIHKLVRRMDHILEHYLRLIRKPSCDISSEIELDLYSIYRGFMDIGEAEKIFNHISSNYVIPFIEFQSEEIEIGKYIEQLDKKIKESDQMRFLSKGLSENLNIYLYSDIIPRSMYFILTQKFPHSHIPKVPEVFAETYRLIRKFEYSLFNLQESVDIKSGHQKDIAVNLNPEEDPISSRVPKSVIGIDFRIDTYGIMIQKSFLKDIERSLVLLSQAVREAIPQTSLIEIEDTGVDQEVSIITDTIGLPRYASGESPVLTQADPIGSDPLISSSSIKIIYGLSLLVESLAEKIEDVIARKNWGSAENNEYSFIRSLGDVSVLFYRSMKISVVGLNIVLRTIKHIIDEVVNSGNSLNSSIVMAILYCLNKFVTRFCFLTSSDGRFAASVSIIIERLSVEVFSNVTKSYDSGSLETNGNSKILEKGTTISTDIIQIRISIADEIALILETINKEFVGVETTLADRITGVLLKRVDIVNFPWFSHGDQSSLLTGYSTTSNLNGVKEFTKIIESIQNQYGTKIRNNVLTIAAPVILDLFDKEMTTERRLSQFVDNENNMRIHQLRELSSEFSSFLLQSGNDEAIALMNDILEDTCLI